MIKYVNVILNFYLVIAWTEFCSVFIDYYNPENIQLNFA